MENKQLETIKEITDRYHYEQTKQLEQEKEYFYSTYLEA